MSFFWNLVCGEIKKRKFLLFNNIGIVKGKMLFFLRVCVCKRKIPQNNFPFLFGKKDKYCEKKISSSLFSLSEFFFFLVPPLLMCGDYTRYKKKRKDKSQSLMKDNNNREKLYILMRLLITYHIFTF